MTDSDNIEILLFGDIVGKPGRTAVRKYTDSLDHKPDFVIGNCENLTHGAGLNKKHYDEMISVVDVLTSGNHIWDRKEIFDFIDSADKLLRPGNYPKMLPGTGKKVFSKNGFKIGVINLMGRLFMPHVSCPWEYMDEAMKELKQETNIIILDFHGEATAEKVAMGYYAQERGASVVFGTHTHVQTADHKIINNSTAYITDLGFTGTADSVIGMEKDKCIERFVKSIPIKADVPELGPKQVCGAFVSIEKSTGKATSIRPFIKILDG